MTVYRRQSVKTYLGVRFSDGVWWGRGNEIRLTEKFNAIALVKKSCFGKMLSDHFFSGK